MTPYMVTTLNLTSFEQTKAPFDTGECDQLYYHSAKYTTSPIKYYMWLLFREVVWNPEENGYRKIAFGELPRLTLSDDETTQVFGSQSIWEIAPQNNPMFTDTNPLQDGSMKDAQVQKFTAGMWGHDRGFNIGCFLPVSGYFIKLECFLFFLLQRST